MKETFYCVLVLPETLASHLGVSSGSVEVDGIVFVRASVTGNGSPSSRRQLRRGGSGWWVCQSCLKQPRKKHRVVENYSSEVVPSSREKNSLSPMVVLTTNVI